jgi:histidinol-phosphate aminotransferase
MDYATLAPEYVRSIAPYVPGKPISEVARELGIPESGIVKLASNENPRGPSPRVREAIVRALDDLTRYPDGAGFELRHALAKRLGVEAGQIVLGNGSNDILELVSQAFLRPGDQVVYSQYSFAVYPLATQARGARGIVVPARAYGHDLPAMRAAITPGTRLVFVANPNNPTGTWLPPAEVRTFVESVPREVIVVLDEAYNEYLEPADRADSIAWTRANPNLVVSRTFSKAYGLAGLRVGYGVMDTTIAEVLDRVRQPFNVNSLAQAAALAALEDEGYLAESHALNRAGMAQICAGLERLGVSYIPSHANFVCVHVGDAAAVNARLLRAGVIVRPVAGYQMPEYLRVSIGTREDNERFLAALATALGR